MKRRSLLWLGIGVAVVLATHALVYALVPQSLLVAELAGQVGNPHVTLAVAGGSVAVVLAAIATLWLAALAVRERAALDPRRGGPPPFAWLRLGLRAVLLFGTTSFAFAMLESTIHWREGLGWHGIHCLVGPVHRNAIPILGALSLLAVALHGAVEHLLAWLRQLVRALAAVLPLGWPVAPVDLARLVLAGARLPGAASPRGPPRPLVPVL